eukprot:526906-Rhodomonas_salina.2
MRSAHAMLMLSRSTSAHHTLSASFAQAAALAAASLAVCTQHVMLLPPCVQPGSHTQCGVSA